MVEIKRKWNSLFEPREISKIRDDFYNKKWISKEEMLLLLEKTEFEKIELIRIIEQTRSDYDRLLSSFNLNALASYELLERQKQGTL